MHNERLDVEDDEQRESRLRHLLQRADTTAPPGPPGPSAFDFGVHETHTVEPPTQLLDRLQQFLPQMEAANADLLRRAQADPESVDIEHLDHTGDGQYIEMNLGLGVFDIRRPASGQAGAGSNSSSNTSDDDASDSSSGDNSSSSAIGGNAGPSEATSSPSSTERPTRPLPRHTRPNIVVLGDTESNSTIINSI